MGGVCEACNDYIFEVKPATKTTGMTLEELFHENLKELNPNFGKVVDFIVKYGGDGGNISFYRPF